MPAASAGPLLLATPQPGFQKAMLNNPGQVGTPPFAHAPDAQPLGSLTPPQPTLVPAQRRQQQQQQQQQQAPMPGSHGGSPNTCPSALPFTTFNGSSAGGGEGGSAGRAASLQLPRCPLISSPPGLAASSGTQGGGHLPVFPPRGAPPPQTSPSLMRSMSIDVGSLQQQGQQHAAAAMGIAGGGSGRGGGAGALYLSLAAQRTHSVGGAELALLAEHHHHAGAGAMSWGPVYDMKSLTSALSNVQPGTGDIQRVLQSSTFKPRLPGLTKLVSQLSREGHWGKALEVYHALESIGVRPDTTIANAAISACDKGGQWEVALEVFYAMDAKGLPRDAITYSAVISALAKGRQWAAAIELFHHMAAAGVECDAVTCCSLITALDKGGQWQMAEQVFLHMYANHPELRMLHQGLKDSAREDGANGVAPPASAQQCALAASLSMALQDMVMVEDGLPAMPTRLASCSSSGDSAAPAAAASVHGASPPSRSQQLQAGSAAGNAAALLREAAAASSGAASPAGGGAALLPRLPSGDLSLLAPSTPAASGGGAGAAARGNAAAPPLSPPMRGGALQRSPSGGLGVVPERCEAGGGAAASAAGGMQPSPFVAAAALPMPPTSCASPPLYRAASESVALQRLLGLRGGEGGGAQQPLQAAGVCSPPTTMPAASPGRLMRAGSLNSKKSAPHRVCCNALLAAYARAAPPQWLRAVRLLQLMWTCGGELLPDQVSYNTVMKACGNAQQIDLAFQVFHLMRSRGVEPSGATFGTLISIASEAQAHERVKEAWAHLKASGLPVPVTCANSYLSALLKEDDWDASWQLFGAMKQASSSTKPNSITYNTLMSACVAHRRPEKVQALFEEMMAVGLAPIVSTFNALITAYGMLGLWGEAVQLLTSLCRPGSSVKPNVATFNATFSALRDAAPALPDHIRGVLHSRAAAVWSLLHQHSPSVGPDVALWHSMIATFHRCGDAPAVVQLCNMAVASGQALDVSCANMGLEGAAAAGLWALAAQLAAAVAAAGGRPSVAAAQAAVVGAASQGDMDTAYALVQACKEASMLEDLFGRMCDASQCELLFLVLLHAKRGAGAWREALALFHSLRRLTPGFAVANGALYGALIDVLVGCGGAAGLAAAVTLCMEAHDEGAMTHFTPLSGARLALLTDGGVNGGHHMLNVSSCSDTEAVVLLLTWLADLCRATRQATAHSMKGAGAAAAGFFRGAEHLQLILATGSNNDSACHAVRVALQGQLRCLLGCSATDLVAAFAEQDLALLGRLMVRSLAPCVSEDAAAGGDGAATAGVLTLRAAQLVSHIVAACEAGGALGSNADSSSSSDGWLA